MGMLRCPQGPEIPPEKIRKRQSVADHPGARGRKAFCATPGFAHKTGRLARTTPATGPMRGLVFADRLGRVGTAFIGGIGLALVRGHAEEVRCRRMACGDKPSHFGQLCDASHSAMGRISENGPQSAER